MARLALLAQRLLTLTFGLAAVASLGVPGCLGRSELEDDGFEALPDAASGKGGTGGTGRGGRGGASGTSGFGGNAGVGGVAGRGGAAGAAGRGGAAGIAGTSAGGSAGSAGKGGTAGVGGAPGCGPSNCKGCCDAADMCRTGNDSNACGLAGVDCLNCGVLGFGCVNGGCEGPPPTCSPANCKGCCDVSGRCRFGTESDACGLNGSTCANCSVQSRGCISGQCQGQPPPVCGPANCGGCCDANARCQLGASNTACGADGVKCSDCAVNGRSCTQPGSYCAYVPTCSSATCPTGCCDASGMCQGGRSNDACGAAGQRCSDCAATNQACAAQGFCYSGSHCGPDNCAGCCAATGECRPGSASPNCGQYGALCDNCVAKGQTCQDRVCNGGQTCPDPYSGCSPSSVTTPPVQSTRCGAADLAALAAACKGTTPGAACTELFARLLQGNPGCYDCLLQFTTEDAYTRCLAPYLTGSCNHDLTCAVNCSQNSCDSCPAGQTGSCEDGVFNQTGQCRPWINGYYCAQAAIQGPASFCDFEKNNDIGLWWQAVGQAYCAL